MQKQSLGMSLPGLVSSIEKRMFASKGVICGNSLVKQKWKTEEDVIKVSTY